MKEDSALTLKKRVDNGEAVAEKQALQRLKQSELIEKLLTPPKRKADTFVGIRAYEWRLLELSEIPFVSKLIPVKDWLDVLAEKTFIGEGFSLNGNQNGLLACHNAMICTILLKLAPQRKPYIDAGIQWILDYQNVERDLDCAWEGKDLYTKYGGCMKTVPCFYGVVKSMIALTEYKKRQGLSFDGEKKLQKGLSYILGHHLYQRLSSNKPIEPSIMENFYPYPYKTNLIELLTLMKDNDLLEHAHCQEAYDILRKKQRSDGFWQADVFYMKSAWVPFDAPGKKGEWITQAIKNLGL
mgnify:CR=1 FL=1